MEYLFAYGTLQDPKIQQQVFGRILEGITDSLLGFQYLPNKVHGRYPAVAPAQVPGSKVEGKVYEVTTEEMKKVDVYETNAYYRIKVGLQSGLKAWVYLENSD